MNSFLYRLSEWFRKQSMLDASAALSQFSDTEQITILMNSCSLGVISVAHDRLVEKLRKENNAS